MNDHESTPAGKLDEVMIGIRQAASGQLSDGPENLKESFDFANLIDEADLAQEEFIGQPLARPSEPLPAKSTGHREQSR